MSQENANHEIGNVLNESESQNQSLTRRDRSNTFFKQPSPQFLFLPVAQSTGDCRMQGTLETRGGGQGVVWASHKSPIPPNGTPSTPHYPTPPWTMWPFNPLSVGHDLWKQEVSPFKEPASSSSLTTSCSSSTAHCSRSVSSNGPDTSALTGPLAERLRAGGGMH